MITRERIKPAADVPLVVTLEDTNAPESHSQYTGLEYRYNVQRGGKPCFIYLPPAAHAQIQKSMAQPGDQIEIVKSLHGQQVFYAIQVLSDAAEPTNLRGHYPAGTTTNGHTNGNGRNVQPINGNGNAPRPGNSHMAQCLCAAVDAAIEASEYARSKNYSVAFLGSDIRAMANSLLIGDQQRGGAA
ncbi:MAG: hypothetical protein ACRD3Y_02270 [Bryobacteraceae bacterium]